LPAHRWLRVTKEEEEEEEEEEKVGGETERCKGLHFYAASRLEAAETRRDTKRNGT
jgi:hypothetical protein